MKHAGTVTIHALDDAGVRAGTVVLALNASETVEFSAQKLQTVDAARELSSEVGNPSSSVRLTIEPDVPIVPLALVRAADGTLPALRDTVPPARPDQRPAGDPGSIHLQKLLIVSVKESHTTKLLRPHWQPRLQAPLRGGQATRVLLVGQISERLLSPKRRVILTLQLRSTSFSILIHTTNQSLFNMLPFTS